MSSLIIKGRQALSGTIRVGGNKNAVLPMISDDINFLLTLFFCFVPHTGRYSLSQNL